MVLFWVVVTAEPECVSLVLAQVKLQSVGGFDQVETHCLQPLTVAAGCSWLAIWQPPWQKQMPAPMHTKLKLRGISKDKLYRL